MLEETTQAYSLSISNSRRYRYITEVIKTMSYTVNVKTPQSLAPELSAIEHFGACPDGYASVQYALYCASAISGEELLYQVIPLAVSLGFAPRAGEHSF